MKSDSLARIWRGGAMSRVEYYLWMRRDFG